MDIVQQLGTALGLGLLSGVRLYLTVLVIGASLRFHWLQLNDSFSGLQVLADWRVMAVAGAACIIEFVADKVPWVDSAWDSVHTFIRPVGAALLGASAFANTDPALRAMLMIVCGGIALTGHSAKSATRLAVNHSPEPFSNIALSLAGDVAVPIATWFTFKYPLATFAIVAVFVIAVWWVSPRIYRAMRVEFATIGGVFSRWLGKGEVEELPPAAIAEFAAMPPGFAEHVRQYPGGRIGIRCAASKGVPGLRSSIGYLTMAKGGNLVFATRRWFRNRTFEAPLSKVSRMQWGSTLMAGVFSFEFEGKRREFEVFRVAEAGLGSWNKAAVREVTD